MRICAAGGLLALAGLGACSLQPGVPTWAVLLRTISGDTDTTTVPIMAMGDHMQMSTPAAPLPGDQARADAIVVAARDVLRRYPDVASAERDGYRPFHQTGEMGEEVHYTSLVRGYAEGRRVDYARPGSILFRREKTGLVPVGVMYAAPGDATPEELSARAPRSVATWHRHVDFCLAAGRDAKALQADPRFGYEGTIHAKAPCEQAGGYWIPAAFGWMTHVYPNQPGKVWGGEGMDMGQMNVREATGAH